MANETVVCGEAVMAKVDVSRRDLLSAGAALGSVALAGQPADARTITGGVPWQPGEAAAPSSTLPDVPDSTTFFSPDERAFIDAAVSRLIPNDDLGPGAKEAGVTVFLDRQLAGPYGSAQTWYMQGPWREGTPSQGNQSRLTPAQTYRTAIKAIDGYCRGTFDRKTFAELSTNEQDRVLGGLEKGEIELDGI
jgi:gluconate 2-dehydrogenase gamma chain